MRNLTGKEKKGYCSWCGKPLKGRRWRYCSNECADNYYKHFAWNTARWWAKERAKYQCEECGFKSIRYEDFLRSPKHVWDCPDLVVHHIDLLNDEDRAWNIKNRPENLVVLCYTCHGKRHSKNYQKRASQEVLFQ